MKKFIKFETPFAWLIVMLPVFLLFAMMTCCSAQKKDAVKQLDENRAAVELNNEATDIIKHSNLPTDEKQKTLAALRTSTGVIFKSSETIEQCIEKKSKIKLQADKSLLKIKDQEKIIWQLISTIIILSVIIIIFIIIPMIKSLIYRYSAAGRAAKQIELELKQQIQEVKDKII